MTRRITAADIAEAAGVSRATVGFVLNNTPGQKISDTTRDRVLSHAARLGYRPHRAAQALARGRSRIVLLVLPDWPLDHSMRQYLDEANHTLDEAGYSLITYTRHAGDRGRPLWESLDPDVVVGFNGFDDEALQSLRDSGITKIFPDPEHRPDASEIAAITVGTRLQVEHLYQQGHRRLAFAGTTDPRLAGLNEQRRATARSAAEDLGLGDLDYRDVDYRDGSAVEAVEQWRHEGVTGVVAYNDDIAATVTGAVLRTGGSVPGDLSVVGHDDSPLAAMFVPALSTVRMDTVGVGRYVAQQALYLADGRPAPAGGPDVAANLVVRESTGTAS